MLELYYNFSTKFCDVNNFEELEMDTDSLYVALAEKELEDCLRPEMEAEWKQLRSKGCPDSFTADAVGNFSPECAVTSTKKKTSESLLFSRRSSCVRKCRVFV